MSYRSDAVRAAIKEWETHPNGRDDLYADEVGGDRGADWCGYFVLRSLKKAGLAKNVRWVQGKGFMGAAGLKRVAAPLPGDVVFVPNPFQHMAMVVSYDPSTGMVTSIDGNQPNIAPRVRFIQNGNIEFYSIQPLVDQAEREAGIVGFLVAGALIAGAAAWAWENGLPRPIEQGLRRLGI